MRGTWLGLMREWKRKGEEERPVSPVLKDAEGLGTAFSSVVQQAVSADQRFSTLRRGPVNGSAGDCESSNS